MKKAQYYGFAVLLIALALFSMFYMTIKDDPFVSSKVSEGNVRKSIVGGAITHTIHKVEPVSKDDRCGCGDKQCMYKDQGSLCTKNGKVGKCAAVNSCSKDNFVSCSCRT